MKPNLPRPAILAVAGVLLLGLPSWSAAQGRSRVPNRTPPPSVAQAPATAPSPSSSPPASARVAVPRSSGGRSGGEPGEAGRSRPVVSPEAEANRTSTAATGQAQRRRAPPSGSSAGRPPSQGSPGPPDTSARRRYPNEGPYTGNVAVRRPPSHYPPGGGWWDNRYYRHYRPSSWYWAPWGWGLGYWVYYDPWWGTYPYPYSYGYGYGYGSYGYVDAGAVRIKMKPREAQVFVDGYYVGIVDDFDGFTQRLQLADGPHRIEVRLDGFEPMDFNVYIAIGRTITLRGELRPGP